MKTLIRLIMILLAVLMLPVVAFCQTVAEAAGNTVGLDPATIFASLSGIVTAVLAVTQFLKLRWHTEGIWTKLLSWFVAVAVCFGGWYFGLGIFANVAWYWIILYGLGAGLVANSIFDLGWVTTILNLFKTKSNG